jgi:hypothetical protein
MKTFLITSRFYALLILYNHMYKSIFNYYVLVSNKSKNLVVPRGCTWKIEIVDPRCIDCVSPKDYGSIMAKECRIPVCKCQLKLEYVGSILHLHISNIINILSILFHIHNILEPTMGVTFFNSGSKSDPTELFPSIV